jgi:mitochondrial splicing suppressor protein 51
MIPLPDGLTLCDLDQRLEKWVKFHNATLMCATIHALRLPRDITRTRTHVLSIFITPRLDHRDAPGKYFRVRFAEPLTIAEAKEKPAPWPQSIAQIETMRQESEEMGRGTVAAACLDCPMLGMQVVPFGSMGAQLSKIQVLDNWMDHLIRDVENGKKFTQFGH